MLTVQINYNTLQESIRHNKAMEEQARNELAESRRHNIVYENETQRHNIQTETIAQGTLNETIRHNVISENELIRHNIQTENIGWYEATTNRNLANSQIAYNNARTSQVNLQNALDQMYAANEREANLQRVKADTILKQSSDIVNKASVITAKFNLARDASEVALTGAKILVNASKEFK